MPRVNKDYSEMTLAELQAANEYLMQVIAEAKAAQRVLTPFLNEALVRDDEARYQAALRNPLTQRIGE